RKPFPAHLPRERVVVPGPTTCSCCGSSRLAKLGENALEVVPRQWKVVQTVREKLPRLREDQPGGGAVLRAGAPLRPTEPASHDPVREIWPASAAQSAVRCARGDRP